MINQITEVLTVRNSRIKCLFKCVNLNLEIVGHAQSQALSGNSKLLSGINEVESLLPSAFVHHVDSPGRYHSFVVSHYFISLISEYEGFLVDLLRIIVRRYPSKIGNVSLKVSDIAQCEELDEAIEIGVNRFLNDLVYKRPKEYIDSINELLSVSSTSELDELWSEFIECKARRDLGIHNDWEINETYIRKIAEVGKRPPPEQFIGPDNDYFIRSTKVIIDLMSKLCTHCAEKFGDRP